MPRALRRQAARWSRSARPPLCRQRLRPAIPADQALCDLPPEVIDNTEIGLRSDWLDGRLRFNATYFDSHWNGMRVSCSARDASGKKQPFPYISGDGAGTARGWEFEVDLGADRQAHLELRSGSDRHELHPVGPLRRCDGQSPGRAVRLCGGRERDDWRSIRDSDREWRPLPARRQLWLHGRLRARCGVSTHLIDQNGNPYLEPAYGILNARFVYEPAAGNYSVELWGKNLTDELYINGGFDTRDNWGYDFSVVGRSREVGLGISFTF